MSDYEKKVNDTVQRLVDWAQENHGMSEYLKTHLKVEVQQALLFAYRSGLAEGLNKSVVAKVPSEDVILTEAKFVAEAGDSADAFVDGVYWLIEQIKAVELKMPVRRIVGAQYWRRNKEHVEGWNDCLDDIIRMNPELFGEIKK